jgi:hypothetical protein
MQQVASIDTSVAALEQALAKQDWASVQRHAGQAAETLDVRLAAGPAVGSLALRCGSPDSKELRAQLKSTGRCLSEAREAAREKDAGRVGAAVRKFRVGEDDNSRSWLDGHPSS